MSDREWTCGACGYHADTKVAALAARLEEVQRERDTWHTRAEVHRTAAEYADKEATDLRARLATAEGERDEAVTTSNIAQKLWLTMANGREAERVEKLKAQSELLTTKAANAMLRDERDSLRSGLKYVVASDSHAEAVNWAKEALKRADARAALSASPAPAVEPPQAMGIDKWTGYPASPTPAVKGEAPTDPYEFLASLPPSHPSQGLPRGEATFDPEESQRCNCPDGAPEPVCGYCTGGR